MIRHRSPISGVDSFGDGLVATAGYDNQVILWDTVTKQAIARGWHDHLANQCRFSACGRYLVSASSDYTARVWSVPDMRLRSVLNTHDDDVEMAAFDGRGERVATASRDASVRVFTADGRELHRLRGHEADVLSVEWVDGREVVSASDDGTVRRWDAEQGRLLETLDFGSVETDTLTILPGTRQFCVGNDHGEIILISGGTRSTIQAHDAGIKRVAAGPGGLVLTTSYDRKAKLWRSGPAGLRHLATIDLPAQVWPRSVAFAGPGRLQFGTFGTTYATYDLVTERWDLSGIAPTGGINAMYVGDAVYTVGDAGIVHRGGAVIGEVGTLCNFIIGAAGRVLTGGQAGRLLDAVTGEVLLQHRSPLNCAAVFDTGGGPRLVVGAYTGEVLVCDGTNLRHLATVSLYDNAVKSVSVNAGHLFSACATGAVAFHALPDLTPVREEPRGHSKIANGTTALADGRFASVGRDLMLRIWTPHTAVAVRTPHEHSVKCVTSAGHLIATGAYDGSVAVYDTGREEWVAFERPTTSGISCVAPAARPGTFLAGSFDGQVYEVRVR